MTFIFDISEWLIHCNTDRSCDHITGGVNLHLRVILLVPVCTVCICVCAISNQSASKSYVILVKPVVNLTRCCRKRIARCFWYQPRYQSLSYQMWYDHTFSQRSKATKTARRRVGKNWRKGGEGDTQYRAWNCHKIGELRTLYQLCKSFTRIYLLNASKTFVLWKKILRRVTKKYYFGKNCFYKNLFPHQFTLNISQGIQEKRALEKKVNRFFVITSLTNGVDRILGWGKRLRSSRGFIPLELWQWKAEFGKGRKM